MKFLINAIALGAIQVFAATITSEPPESTIEPSISAIAAAAATQAILSPKSDVKGIVFDRFIQVWLENTDYSAASGNGDLQFLASQGISLTNYFATTHPSEPNYCASVAGDNFGMDNDDFHSIPANISTLVDLLDTKGISWAEYQEDMPYPGFQGFNYSNQVTYANAYVRKHNPLILFDSVTKNATRLSLIKNLTSLELDIAKQALPQWAFITPNMTNDGHDTNITFASAWERDTIAPLLNNDYFMNNTLILLTFDETETYTQPNKIFSILLGGAIPDSLKGTTDDTFYNHYSSISTISVNWGLPSLGRWDCEANVFELVASKTGYKNAVVDTANLYFNQSYPGPLSHSLYIPDWPVPETSAKCASGLGVLKSVQAAYANMAPTYNYTNVYPYDAPANNSNGGTPVTGSQVTGGQVPGTSSSSSHKHLSGGGIAGIAIGIVAFLALCVGAFLYRRRTQQGIPQPKQGQNGERWEKPELDGKSVQLTELADNDPVELPNNPATAVELPTAVHQ